MRLTRRLDSQRHIGRDLLLPARISPEFLYALLDVGVVGRFSYHINRKEREKQGKEDRTGDEYPGVSSGHRSGASCAGIAFGARRWISHQYQ